MLKANNKDTRTTSLTLFLCPYCQPGAQPTPCTSVFATKFERENLQGLIIIKSYLRYKIIFCHKVALDVWLMIFFIWRKNNVSLLRYLDFYVFVKSTNFKICDVIIGITTYWKLHLCIIFFNPKYYQTEIWSNASVLCGKHF